LEFQTKVLYKTGKTGKHYLYLPIVVVTIFALI
jgi:hypothetical protein